MICERRLDMCPIRAYILNFVSNHEPEYLLFIATAANEKQQYYAMKSNVLLFSFAPLFSNCYFALRVRRNFSSDTLSL